MSPPWSGARALPAACALPTLGAGAVGLGAWLPGAVEALALATLCGWVVLAQRALRAERTPTWQEWALALAGAGGTAVVVLAGGLSGFGSSSPPELAGLLRSPTAGVAALSALALGALAAWPALIRAWRWGLDVTPPARPPLRRAWTSASAVVLLTGATVHAVAFCLHPGPLVQVDSYVNLFEPPLFTFGVGPFHHTPLYSELVKLADRSGDPVASLSLLVAGQHALVVAAGVLVERMLRLSGHPLAGFLAGMLLVTCGQVSVYAQEVMSEIPSVTCVVLATAGVFEAARRPRPAGWLLLAGLAAAAATLTRQAMQGWFVAGAIAIALLGFPQRGRALTIYLLGALLPVALMIVHNGVFQGRFALTASLGRNLHYRVAHDLPDLTDPDAPPGDPHERARELIWEARDAGWVDSYSAIQRELGWDDAQIEQAMKRFYVEQIVRHPLPFTRVTLRYCGVLLRAREDVELVLRGHDQVSARATVWRELPRAASPQGALGWLHAFQPTSSWPVLLLALISPLVTRGPGRALALACLASVAYFVVVTSLVEWPVPRYRIPAIPFLAIACGLSVGGLVRRVAPRPLKVPS